MFAILFEVILVFKVLKFRPINQEQDAGQ